MLPLQNINGIDVAVVEFATMPEMPITAADSQEVPYAHALEDAIETGVITEPGKYGIHVTPRGPKMLQQYNYNIYRIDE